MSDVTLPLLALVTLATVLASLAGSYALTKYLAERAGQKVEDVARDLNAFRLEAARRFVTDDMLMTVEARVIDAINRLADRLDRLIEAKR